MDHVASGWNGRKSNNMFVPDKKTNGVSVVRGDSIQGGADGFRE